MNYWEIRKAVSRIIPRATVLFEEQKQVDAVREKGRKKNYHQFNLVEREWRKQERLLSTEEINSFLEISVRAAACPMPFNMDIWDGLLCPYGCLYCYANAFRASLYTAFFDNSKTMGFRHCNPDYYRAEMDKMEKYRSRTMEEKRQLNGINKAFALEIPARLGIRFEDFAKEEALYHVGLEMLRYLAKVSYPVMINTKSDLVGTDEYTQALADNKAGAAVHITCISSDNNILSSLEPGAPSYAQRLKAMANLVSAGVRVVARIEPFLFLVNDQPEAVEKYIHDVWATGVRNITFDTYSYTALNPGIRQSFINAGFDFDRIYLAGCDSQALGSLLLGSFMDLFREKGFSCSTFDMGNVPSNNQSICCEVGDWFKGGFNYGCTVMAARFIMESTADDVRWSDFEAYVNHHGGFLTEELKKTVKGLWNLEGNIAYSHHWAAGLTSVGIDEDGIIWKYVPEEDHRMNLLKEIL